MKTLPILFALGVMMYSLPVLSDQATISDFAFDTFQLLSGDKNSSYSPYSTAKALELLSLGLEGESLKKVKKLLEHEELSAPNTKVAEILIANAFWSDPSITIKEKFKKDITVNLKAQAGVAPFLTNPDKAVATINDWAKDKTKGLIPQLVTSADVARALTVLANSLYVKARWSEDEELLKQNIDFQGIDGVKTKIKFLWSDPEARQYYRGDGVEIVELTLGQGDIHLGIILPDPGVNYLNWKKQVKASQVSQWLKKLTSQLSVVKFPEFVIETQFNLNDALARVGLGGLFSENPDFKRITDSPMKISQVKQKVKFEANEEGIEAAAITYTSMEGASAPSGVAKKIIEVLADRPFLFYLATQKNRHILFLGQYVKPEKAN